VSKRQLIALVLVFSGIGIISGLLYVRLVHSTRTTAGLKVESEPPSVVFVDNVQVGRTPLDKFFAPGEATVRLVPETTSTTVPAYQTKVRLTNKVYTVIRREFAETDALSAGETISLIPYTGSQSALSVVTTDPESALVTVDGQSQGFSPVSLTSIAASDHLIEVSAPGYNNRTVSAKTITGYQLSVSVKLSAKGNPSPPPSFPSPSPSPVATASATLTKTPPTPTPTPSMAKPYVKISSTPTGFLRVRSAPSKAGSEIGQVKPGETYSLLDQSQPAGWYLIKVNLEATTSGWISSEYAQLFK
jgi:hypothetical protein